MADFDVSIDTDDGQAATDTFENFGVDGLYADSDRASDLGVTPFSVRGDSSDEVDPRKLVRDPTLSEIRWYYRRTFAKILVDKPVDDAFKNGFDFVGDNQQEARDLIEQPRFVRGGSFVEAYKLAQKKARRDGFSLLFMGTQDSGPGIHVSPIGDDVAVNKISHVKVLTIDHLTDGADSQTHEQIEQGTGLDRDDYRIRPTGIVINNDISSPRYRTPVGYVLDGTQPQFLHADRVEHYTWNQEVDGDYHSSGNKRRGVQRFEDGDNYLGQWEGDSVLIPSYDLMKGIAKGNWAIMQAVFRHASHMYHVTLPQGAGLEHMEAAEGATRNINAKSSLVFPHGYEMEQHESGQEMEPREYFDVIFDQVCAVHEMTKSVLFGTQTGTVSGSETDIKNYFSKVERFRSNRAASDIESYLTRAKRMLDGRTNPDYEYSTEIDWGPLFKVDAETRIQMMQTSAQALTTAIGQYVLTPDEAREILTEQFTEIDFDGLTESQMDVLDRIRLASSGQGPQALASEREYTEGPPNQSNPRTGGEEGGRPEGSQQNPEQSGTTPTDSLAYIEQLRDDGHISAEDAAEIAASMAEDD